VRVEPFTLLRSPTVLLPADDVDTDQIVPARFLKGTTREGLGAALFADWRYHAEGRPRTGFPLNEHGAAAARVLVAGRNFGCGSSREHAVWALRGFGFRAVLALSFADIFRRNALKNGLLPVEVDAPTHARLAAEPGGTVTVDLEACLLHLPGGERRRFTIDPFARHCLLSGLDELSFLLARDGAIASFERGRPAWRVEVESHGSQGRGPQG
jgi:3-isopropylmalate/(R)-2-methylmalate dehydratase small subunit